jgi:hypothetical protein
MACGWHVAEFSSAMTNRKGDGKVVASVHYGTDEVRGGGMRI